MCVLASNSRTHGAILTRRINRPIHNKLCGRPPQYAPRPGLQRKRAPAALSQAGQAGPDQPIRAIPAGRPHTPPADRMHATDRRQTDRRQTPDIIIA